MIKKKSVEFVNCREIVLKNQYHKRIDDSRHHNYHLLIHQLQPESLLVPQFKTVFQVLTDKLARLSAERLTTAANNQSSSLTRFSTYAKIFAKCRDLVEKELNKPSRSSASLTLFIPMDAAFKSLRRDQIESLWADRTCAFKFVMQNIVSEEICPVQLMKYGVEYSSRTQKADLIAVADENGTTSLYFNGQKVNTAKSYPASNGVIYRLSSLQLAGVVDFLYDIVVGFRKKFANQFIESLSSNWLETLRNESKNVTLFMPFEAHSHKNLSMIFNSTKNGSNQSTISIRDYIIKPRLSFYELNNGDVLTSLSGHKYLISTYPFESSLSELVMRLIPRRNLERKAINCQQLEVPDLSACNAQLIVFKSDANRIPELNTESLLEYIRRQPDLSVFSSLLRLCGLDCNSLLSNFNQSRGYTILLPTNEYFNKALYNFQKFSNSLVLFKRSLKANTLHGTYCGFYLKYDVSIENAIGRKVNAKRITSRLVKTDVYLSKSGIIAHKVHEYF